MQAATRLPRLARRALRAPARRRRACAGHMPATRRACGAQTGSQQLAGARGSGRWRGRLGARESPLLRGYRRDAVRDGHPLRAGAVQMGSQPLDRGDRGAGR
jgi:hypothetical protein